MSRLGTYSPWLRSTLQSGCCSISDLTTRSTRSCMTLSTANPRHSQGREWETIINRKKSLSTWILLVSSTPRRRSKHACSVETRGSPSLAPRLMSQVNHRKRDSFTIVSITSWSTNLSAPWPTSPTTTLTLFRDSRPHSTPLPPPR